LGWVGSAVDVQEISVEELAESLLGASSRAESSIERTTGEDERAKESIGAKFVERSVDCGITQGNRVGVPGNGRDGCAYVAIRTGNDNQEVLAPLAVVDSITGSDRTTPECTLDQRRTRRIRTIVARLDRRASFPIYVERCATCKSSTFGRALVDIISSQGGIAEVAISIVRGIEVLEGLEVSRGGLGGKSGLAEVRES
jgi:hypothetical protein